MSKNNVWAVLDVSEEAKDEAKKRAKLEGKKIGIWLSKHIMGKGNVHENPDETLKSNSFIARGIDEIKLGMKAIYDELGEIKMNIHPIPTPKKSFFSKFLG